MTNFDESRKAEMKRLLNAGLDALTTGDDWQRYLAFQAQFPHYSFGNMMLILTQKRDATLVMAKGERQDGKHVGWKAAGRTVIPSTPPIWIWKPYVKTVKSTVAGEDDKKYQNFHLVEVFDISDTIGDPIPEPVSRLEHDDVKGLLKLTLEFITAQGFTYEFVPETDGSANGDMNPTGKHIRICTAGRSTGQQAKTALHEAAHMILHASGKGLTIPREQKEIEAESAAFIVSAHLGVDTGAYSFGYIAAWAASTGFSARTAVKHSGKRIQQAADKIIKFIQPEDAAGDYMGPAE